MRIFLSARILILFLATIGLTSCTVKEGEVGFLSDVTALPINSPAVQDSSNVGDISAGTAASFRSIVRLPEVFSSRARPSFLRTERRSIVQLIDVAIVTGDERNAECMKPEVAPFCISRKFEGRVRLQSLSERTVRLTDKFVVLEALNRPYSRENYNRNAEQRIRQIRSTIISTLSRQGDDQWVSLNEEKIFFEDVRILVPVTVGEGNLQSVLSGARLERFGVELATVAATSATVENGFFVIRTDFDVLKSARHFRLNSVSGYEDPFALLTLADPISVEVYPN